MAKQFPRRTAVAAMTLAILAAPMAPVMAEQRYARAPATVDGLPPSPVEISENPGKATRNKSDQERREACELHRSAKSNAIGGPSDAAILDQAIEMDCPK